MNTADLEQQALSHASDSKALKRQLFAAKAVLRDCYRQHFRQHGYRFSFKYKMLRSKDGSLALIWLLRPNPYLVESYDNQQTSVGCVELRRSAPDRTDAEVFALVHAGLKQESLRVACKQQLPNR